MKINRERITDIKCDLTPSHQSDLPDTLMCKFIPLLGKKEIIHGDYHYADYHRDYKKEEPLTLIESFKIDIKDLLENGGKFDTFRNKLYIKLPTETINIGDKNDFRLIHFPSFICGFKESEKEHGIDIICKYSYNSIYRDFELYRKEYPDKVRSL